jgi:PAS domain S-box-containing protein
MSDEQTIPALPPSATTLLQQLWQWLVSPDTKEAAARRSEQVHNVDYRQVIESQKEQLTLLSAALTAAANAIVLTDRTGVVLWVNPAFLSLTGYTREEVVGCNPRFLSSGKQDREYYRQMWDTILSGRVWHGELINRRKDGSLYSEEMTITPVLLCDGEASHFIAIKQDVTKRKKREQDLRDAKEKYREMFEDSVLGMFQSTPEGRYLRMNRAMARLLGADSSQAYLGDTDDLGKQFYVDPGKRKEFESLMKRQGYVRDFEYQAYRRDGTKLWLMENARAVHGEKAEIIYYEGTVQDISERKILETQLLQAQKMEAVGSFAGGVAHDFNNMLSVISGYSELIMLAPDQPEDLLRQVKEIKKASERAAALTRQLLAFSRRQVFQPRVFNINATIAETSSMLRRLIGEDVELVFKPDPSLGNTKADPAQIVQILMNLAVNARDAMRQGGQLIIETRNAQPDQTYLAQHSGAHNGDHILVTVSDTGAGMDPETLSHIFEPFFTTKESGNGTGLGLSIVYGIVKQSGGYISVDSEPGKGSTFKICLPRVYEDVRSVEPVASAEVVSKHNETVLLVEDQAELRSLMSEFLGRFGFQVLEAADGCEAVQIAQTYAPIHALITDVVMPGINGHELAGLVGELCPGIKVIYVSGYSPDAVTARGILPKGVVLVEKPLELGKLAEALDYVLSPIPPQTSALAPGADGTRNDLAKKSSAGHTEAQGPRS